MTNDFQVSAAEGQVIFGRIPPRALTASEAMRLAGWLAYHAINKLTPASLASAANTLWAAACCHDQQNKQENR